MHVASPLFEESRSEILGANTLEHPDFVCQGLSKTQNLPAVGKFERNGRDREAGARQSLSDYENLIQPGATPQSVYGHDADAAREIGARFRLARLNTLQSATRSGAQPLLPASWFLFPCVSLSADEPVLSQILSVGKQIHHSM